MQLKYRLYQRKNGNYYWQANDSKRQGSLKTSDRRDAERLLHAMNESQRQPILNLNLAKTYLAAHDPLMISRPWIAVMAEMATHGIPTTQERCARAFRAKAYDSIRHRPLVQTTTANLLAVLHANGNCVGHYLRRLHNLAVDLGWLAWPILAKRAWPKLRSVGKRAVKDEEHQAIINSEQNSERRAFYTLLYETGAAQTDGANMAAEDIDWRNGVLVYRRKKLGPHSEPARLTIGAKLRVILQNLPSSGHHSSRASGTLLRITVQPSSADAAESPGCRESACTVTGTPGRSEPRVAATPKGSRKRLLATAAARCTRHTRRAQS